MGADIEIAEDSQRLRPANSEVERLWCDNARAARLLDWLPEFGGHNGLRRGLARTIEWFVAPANRAFYRPDVNHV